MLLLSILAASVASALVPLINIEAILVVASGRSDETVLALVVAATVGQMLGKVIWYWGGQHVERAPWVNRHLQKPKAKAALERWHARAEGRPWFTAGLLFVSASTGFPPYAVTAVLAGMLRVPLGVFLLTGLLGRGLRFWVIVSGTASVLELW